MTDEQTMIRQLADKWHEVPSALRDRTSSRALLALGDRELLDEWERARADTSDGPRALAVRGWYHLIYGPWAAGKKILEIGSGIGIDGVTFGQAGAAMTFVDVSRTNLDVVRRVWSLKGLGDARFLHLERFEDLDTLDTDYDAVFAFGSMHHIPAAIGKPEFDALARRLKPGGRFVMHAYPHSRWVADGQMPFEEWGGLTDGPGTPWAEWYDPPKLIGQLLPARFALVFYCEFRAGAMNAIDLIKLDGHPTLDPLAMPAGAREVPDAVRLADASTAPHWRATLARESDGVDVTTATEPWSYAAEIPLRLDGVPANARCFIRVDLTVTTGTLGVCLVCADGSSVVAEEQVEALPAEQVSLVWFNRDAGASTVILRNAALSVRTHARVRSVRLYCL